jgi:chromate transporter
LAVVLQAIWGLAPKAAKTLPLRCLGLFALGAALFGGGELYILFGAGLVAALWARLATKPEAPRAAPWLPWVPLATAAPLGASAVTLPGLFGVFVKIGSVLFGSGYVLLSFLRAELVAQRGWLSESQLIDAVAVGQVTPGPVFTTATFIGYLLAGTSGALVATAGIFLPAFVFVALSGPLVPRLRSSVVAGGFLDGVNVASLGLMGAVTVQLGRAALVDLPSALVGLVAALLLVRWRLNATWLIAGGALLGLGLQWVR